MLVARAASFVAAGFGGQQGGAVAGVKPVSFAAPARPAGTRPSTSDGLLGTGISDVASGLLIGLLLLGAGGVAVALILADAAGQGPRHEQWRLRVGNRIRRLR
jgi:hypothetical protein